MLRFTIPAGVTVAAAVISAYALARSHNLPPAEQHTAATLVAVMLSLSVLIILGLPLTWRRALLVGAMILGFVLLFPFAAARKFFALELPTDVLGATLLIGLAGIAVLLMTTELLRRVGHGPAAASQTRTLPQP